MYPILQKNLRNGQGLLRENIAGKRAKGVKKAAIGQKIPKICQKVPKFGQKVPYIGVWDVVTLYRQRNTKRQRSTNRIRTVELRT